MAPIRRYLRISKHSVLECRIFLENPADGPRWLLNPSNPALPRVFEVVRPYVLPKLREENERAKGKGKKKKAVKDVFAGDDFEVSVFLTEIRTRHAILVKQKTFQEKANFGANNNHETGPLIVHEDSDNDEVDLNNIPQATDDDDTTITGSRARAADEPSLDHSETDDKKKLAFNTTYDGFAIWGKVLCLLVERKNMGRKGGGSTDGGGQALMQEWITASQQQAEDDT